MANYANQLTFKLQIGKTLHTANDQSGESYAPLVIWKYKKAAMKKLTGNGYKLWEYLYSWAGSGIFDFSPKRINEEIGISQKGLQLARKELEESGCLKLEEGKANVWIFTPDSIL